MHYDFYEVLKNHDHELLCEKMEEAQMEDTFFTYITPKCSMGFALTPKTLNFICACMQTRIEQTQPEYGKSLSQELARANDKLNVLYEQMDRLISTMNKTHTDT